MLTTVALLSFIALAAEPLAPGEHTRTLEVDGLTRNYVLHIPAKLDAQRPMPVVLAFHGAGSNARQTAILTGLNAKADKVGFLVAYPNGTGVFSTWNAGLCCGSAERNDVDDVAFVRAILDDLDQVAKVDKQRIYATGMSNGAMMSYRLASEMADRIAAIAPVAGTMELDRCQPSRPVSVIHFHGTEDEFVPLAGGSGRKTLAAGKFNSVDESIRAWVVANGCPNEPTVVEMPNTADDGLTVTRKNYAPGKDGAEVILYIVRGGGHTWPGHDFPIDFLGKSTKDVSATDLIWDFFVKHPMK